MPSIVSGIRRRSVLLAFLFMIIILLVSCSTPPTARNTTLTHEELDTIQGARVPITTRNIFRPRSRVPIVASQYHVSHAVIFEVRSGMTQGRTEIRRGVPVTVSTGFRNRIDLLADTPGTVPDRRVPTERYPLVIPINFEDVNNRRHGTTRDILFVRSDTPAGQLALQAWDLPLPPDVPIVWILNVDSSRQIDYDGQTFTARTSATVVPHLMIRLTELGVEDESSRTLRGSRVR